MLYTRKGDKGDTSFFDSKDRFSKSSTLAEALGTLDELNSYIGLIRSDIRERKKTFFLSYVKKEVSVEKVLSDIQQNLFIIQAELAGAPKKIEKTKITTLEKITDSIEKIIPPLTSFSLSGSSYLSSLFDFSRTIARRAERRIVAVSLEKKLSSQTLAYMNRLSSALFALARYANHKEEVKEESPHY
jgi:cob(I)alamin adenosyltransferase